MQRTCKALLSVGYEVVMHGRNLITNKVIEHLPVRPYPLILWNLPFNRGPLFYAVLNLWCFARTALGKYDIACAVDVDTLPGVWLGARLRGKPVVVDLHEWMSEVPEVVNRPRIQAMWRWVEQTIIPKTRAQITVGEALATAYKAATGVEPVVVYNMPLQEVLIPKTSLGNSKKLIYQGALNVGRGLEVLIEAVEHLPDYELHLFGTGDLDAELRHLAKKNGQRIHFHGAVSPSELPAHTRTAFLGFNLLENLGKSYYYSAANKFFDYVQAGVPVVTMNFPEYLHLMGEFEVGAMLDDLNPQAIVEVVRLAENAEVYEKWEANCLKASEKWCWETQSPILLQIYDAL